MPEVSSMSSKTSIFLLHLQSLSLDIPRTNLYRQPKAMML